MMKIPGRTMLVCFGVLIGAIFFGANVIVENYNRVVAPEKPLVLMDWRMEQEKLEVTLLGDTCQLNFKEKFIGEVWTYARAEIENKIEMMQQVVYEIKFWP